MHSAAQKANPANVGINIIDWQLLTQAWLDRWHGRNKQCEDEFQYSSVIQQALVLEVHSASFNALRLQVVGWNGQLPQLDLYFLVKRLAEMGSGLQVTQVTVLPLHKPTVATVARQQASCYLCLLCSLAKCCACAATA